MSTPARSTVLGALNLTDGATHDLVTCPAGITYIVKDVRAVNAGSAATQVSVWVQATSGVVAYLQNGSMNANATAGVTSWVVMRPGDKLRAFATTGPVHVWVSGTRLQGAASMP